MLNVFNNYIFLKVHSGSTNVSNVEESSKSTAENSTEVLEKEASKLSANLEYKEVEAKSFQEFQHEALD